MFQEGNKKSYFQQMGLLTLLTVLSTDKFSTTFSHKSSQLTKQAGSYVRVDSSKRD